MQVFVRVRVCIYVCVCVCANQANIKCENIYNIQMQRGYLARRAAQIKSIHF